MDEYLVDFFGMLPRRFGTPVRRGYGIEHIDFDGGWLDVVRPFDPRLVRTVIDDRHDGQTRCNRHVNKAKLEWQKTSVSTPRSLGHDPNGNAMASHHLDDVVDRRDRLGFVFTIQCQMAGQEVQLAEKWNSVYLPLHHTRSTNGTEPNRQERIERGGVIGNINRRMKLIDFIHAAHDGIDTRNPHDGIPYQLPIIIAEFDAQYSPRQEHDGNGHGDGRCNGNEKESDDETCCRRNGREKRSSWCGAFFGHAKVTFQGGEG